MHTHIQIVDLVFTIMDKDNSKTLELEEVTSFMSKMVQIAVDAVRAGIKV